METGNGKEGLQQVSSCEAVKTRIAKVTVLRASRPHPSFFHMLDLRPSAFICGSLVFVQ